MIQGGGMRRAAIAALLVASACAPASPPGAYPRPVLATSQDLLEFERSIVRMTNENRAVIRLLALEVDPLLTEIARAHSRDMSTGTVPFGHDGFEARADRAIAELGVLHMGENVATSNHRLAGAPGRTMRDWMGSPPHRANIEGRFNLTGVGVVQTSDGRFFITQLFAFR